MKQSKIDAAIGMTITCILCAVVAASFARVYLAEPKQAFAQQKAGDDALRNAGKSLYQVNCAGCHGTDTTEGKYAPGLKGISKTGKLPASGRPATEEHVRDQLKKPFKSMPPFDKLSDQDIRALTAYVLSL